MDKDKVPIRKLLEVYADCADYRKTASHFGLVPSTVHIRICRYMDRQVGAPWAKVVQKQAVKYVLENTVEEDDGTV